MHKVINVWLCTSKNFASFPFHIKVTEGLQVDVLKYAGENTAQVSTLKSQGSPFASIIPTFLALSVYHVPHRN